MEQTLDSRLRTLERRLRRTRQAFAACALVTLVLVISGMRERPDPVHDVIRARRVVVLDERGVERLVLGRDPAGGQRRSRATGLNIHDSTGAERGGFSTMDDGSVVLGLDAPVGVGHPMRDRVGLAVWPDGSAYVMVLDNKTRGVAKLIADANGAGGVQVFQWNDSAHQVYIKTLTYEGHEVSTYDLGP